MNDKIYTLKFSEKDLAILNSALMELPFKIVVKLINDINAQLQNNQEDKHLKETTAV